MLPNYPTLHTDRLLLRQPIMTDVDAIAEQANHEGVAAGTLNLPYPYQRSDAIHYVNWVFEKGLDSSNWTFAICLKETGQFMGVVGMQPDTRHQHGRIGYWIGHTHWGQGYTTEAVREILTFGFKTLNLRRIYAEHFVDNPASGRVMQKAGMTYEGTLRQHYQRHDVFHDVAYYGILREEWLDASE